MLGLNKGGNQGGLGEEKGGFGELLGLNPFGGSKKMGVVGKKGNENPMRGFHRKLKE